MAVIDSAELLLQPIYSGSGDWQDQSGNSHHGVVTGATWDTDHWVFDATGEKIVVPDHADLDFGITDDFTYMVVFETADATPAATMWLMGKKSSLGPGDAGCALWLQTNGYARGLVADTVDAAGTDAPSACSDNTKHVIAFVRDQSVGDDITTFIDGSPTASPPNDDTTLTLANAIGLTFGQRGAQDDTSRFYGFIYAAAVWRSGLSTADVVTAGTEILQTAVELTATISTTATVATSSLALSQENAFTLIPDGDQTGDSVINEQGATSNTYLSIDDDPDSPDLSDYIFTQGVDGYKFYDLSATPGDFSAVTSSRIRADVRKINISGFTVNLYAQIFDADEVTDWTDEVVVATEATSDGLVEASYFTINATGLAATKGEWDTARVKLRWDYT